MAGSADVPTPHRPRVDPHHRQRADRDRPGLRVRLLGHAGVPRAARRGLPRRARELEPGDDHDRPRVRRRHLRRAARRRQPAPDHRARAPGRAAADARRPDRAEPRDRARTRPACSPSSASSSSARASRRSTPRRTAVEFKAAMVEIGLAVPKSGLAYSVEEALAVGEEVGFPLICRPSFILGGGGTGIAYDVDELRAGRRARPRRRARSSEILLEQSVRRVEGVRARGHARPRGQRGRHLLDRERRPDGRAHRRLDHGRAGADAHRRRVPAHARRRVRVHPAHRRRHRRLERAVRRSNPDERRDGHHRDEPARVALERARRARPPGSRSRRSRRSSRSATGSTRSRNDITERHARELRADDRLRRHEDPALGVREAARARRRCSAR